MVTQIGPAALCMRSSDLLGYGACAFWVAVELSAAIDAIFATKHLAPVNKRDGAIAAMKIVNAAKTKPVPAIKKAVNVDAARRLSNRLLY